MRQRAGVSAALLVAVIMVGFCLVDLGLTATDSSRSRTTLGHVPPYVEAALLGVLAVGAGWEWVRTRRTHSALRAELATTEEEADRLLKVIDNTSAVIYLRDLDGRYLLVNRQYEQLFGVKRADIVGLTDHDLFPPEMADAFRENDLRALARGAPVQMEELAPDIDGPHTYITVKYPVTDVDGRPNGICGISTDITPLKRAEEKERALNAELEDRVRARTAELEASTRELDAFAYSVSHDLRAPLRAMAGFSEVLLEDHSHQLDETGRAYLHRVTAAAMRMNQLIDDLLDLSRASRVELTRQRVDLSALATRVTAEVQTLDGSFGGEAEVSIDEELSAVGDPVLLEHVLLNLISNARKFTANVSQPRIHFGAEQEDGSLVYFVQDNGVGFDMRYADKLFTPFQRLHSADDFPGSGIGLAIVNRIVTRHGGRVWAEGKPGEGAVFRFTLPRPQDPPRVDGRVPGWEGS